MKEKNSWWKEEISPVRAIFWIVASLFFVTGISYSLARHWIEHHRLNALQGPSTIQVLAQTGPEKEALPSSYLCELMEISVDHPMEMKNCNPKDLENKLLSSPLIEKASVHLAKPHTVYVDYVMRMPIAEVYDYPNTFIDVLGYLFPCRPFFSPKKLPQVYFGQESFQGWKRPLEGRYFDLARDVLKCLSQIEFAALYIQRIDVSMAFAPSYGKREIVVQLQEEKISGNVHEVFPVLMRLSSKEYRQELTNYLQLRKQFLEKTSTKEEGMHVHSVKIIDFRIPQLAFIQDSEEEK